jgi:sulfite exporter TauE/SafE
MPDINPFLLSTTPYLTAFLTGLLGGVHCVGMCGGIAGALAQGIAPELRQRSSTILPITLGYNLGRLFSYTLAGALVGYLGYNAGNVTEQYKGWMTLRIVAGVFMIVLGLYLGRWWFGLIKIEQLGGRLWQRISGLTKKLLPVRHAYQAISLGALWGWLPCGLVYSMLVFSFAAGGWLQGAGFMLSFGLGTLPVLLGVGMAAGRITTVLQTPMLRYLAGLLVISFGVWTIIATVMTQANVGLGCVAPS